MWRDVLPKVQYYMSVQNVDNVPEGFDRLFSKLATRELVNGMGVPCGIMLCGGTGNGKTYRMRFIQRNMRGMRGDDRHFVEANVLVDMLKGKESDPVFREKILTDYSYPPITPTGHDYELIIDDLGNETAVSHVYGELNDTIGRVINERYKAFMNYGHLTHFSTNLQERDLKDRYGERIYSRLREMCVIVTMPDFDRRINKVLSNGRG